MSTQTDNLKLNKPDTNDFYDIAIHNENMDIIDEEITELKKSVSDGKTLVANAITGKGVATATNAEFVTMATNINTVATNKYNEGVTYADGRANASSTNYITGYNAGVSATKKGTASASQVLSGYTFTNASSVGSSGTMTNNGAVSQTLNADGSYTIPVGYHNGSGKVTANSLASQTSGTATSNQILSGQTAWVNGSKVTGTIPDNSSNEPDAKRTYIYDNKLYMQIPLGYYDGTDLSNIKTSFSSVVSAVGLTADKLVSGSTILGVSGTATVGKRYASGTFTSSDYANSGSPQEVIYWYKNSGSNWQSVTYGTHLISVSGLSFTPSKIMLSYRYGSSQSYAITSTIYKQSGFYTSGNSVYNVQFNTMYYSGLTSVYTTKKTNVGYVAEGSFMLPFAFDNMYNDPVFWEAWE